MSKVIVRTRVRVTTNKGNSCAQEVYEFEQRISQEDQQSCTANRCHCAASGNQDDDKQRKVTISLEC
jgi:hypothetical protein